MYSQRVATAGDFGNGQDPGTTQRPPASAFLLIDSADRRQGGNNVQSGLAGWDVPTQPQNNFVIQKRQTFMSGFFNRIALTEVRLPFATPNVNERNNKIQVITTTPAGLQTVTVPEGYYTPVELAAEFQVQLLAIPGLGQTFAVTYAEEYGYFTITSNDAFQLIPFSYDTYAQTLKGLYFMMNWGQDDGGTAANATRNGEPFPNLQYTAYVDICSRQLTQYQTVKDNSTRSDQVPAVVARVYLNNFVNENLGDGDTSAKLTWPGCRPQMVHRIYNVPKYSGWNPGAFVDQIDIQLYDDAGNLLYYPDEAGGSFNANDFQLTFHCSEN